MASYTENYALTKPTMAESADIRVINSNMDTVDDVMHSTQISLAPAYDMNETYNTGDVVMYELLMYECLEDEVTGTWDATKWQRTTAGEHGGGSDVEVTQIQTEGKAVASIAVDGVSTNILIPELKVYGEATGDLITIEDAMEAPLEECKVTLEPQQDLHGYEYPWIGGSGRNKMPSLTVGTYTNSGYTAKVSEDGKVSITGTNSGSGNVTITIPLSGSIDLTTSHYLHIRNTVANASMTIIAGSWYTGIAPINKIVQCDGSDSISQLGIYIASVVGEVNLTIQPSFELSDAVTDFAPYSNICPISGWSEANVSVCGKNLYKVELNNYYLDTTTGQPVAQAGYEISEYIPIQSGQSIYIPASGTSRRWFYDKYKNPKIYLKNSEAQTYIAQEDGYIRVTLNKTISVYSTFQVEYGNQATTYTPYNGQTITLDLDGTRYGGTLDVVSGVLTVDRVYKTLTSNENFAQLGANNVYMDSWTDIFKPSTNTLGILQCSHYEEKLQFSGNHYAISKPINNRAIVFYDDDHATSVADFKAYVTSQANNGTPITVCYKLETPLTYQLTPTEVKSLLGSNNVWSDGEMYVKYRRDIEMLLQRIADSLGGNA